MADPTPLPEDPQAAYPPEIRSSLTEAMFGHEDHPDVRAMHDQLDAEKPDHGLIVETFERLHLDPEIGAKISLWWHDPRTVNFISELNGTGI